jgi:hypothetical protein
MQLTGGIVPRRKTLEDPLRKGRMARGLGPNALTWGNQVGLRASTEPPPALSVSKTVVPTITVGATQGLRQTVAGGPLVSIAGDAPRA